jgi:hypothetical protein
MRHPLQSITLDLSHTGLARLRDYLAILLSCEYHVREIIADNPRGNHNAGVLHEWAPLREYLHCKIVMLRAALGDGCDDVNPGTPSGWLARGDKKTSRTVASRNAAPSTIKGAKSVISNGRNAQNGTL